jgi:hypothetical protein
MDEIRILTPTGMLGYGFPIEDFKEGLKRKPHVIAVDSGSTDSGPQKLGNGSTTCTYEAYYKDIGILLQAAHQCKVPVYISSSGGAGSNEQVDLFVDIVKKISEENNYHFKIAVIYANIEKELIKRKLKQKKIQPCGPVAELTEEEIDAATTIVAQMGVEPYLKAIDEDVDIIISGRAYDPVPIAALGIKNGFDLGLCWHLGKIMECGALCAGAALKPIVGYLRKDHFIVEPMSPELKCTEASVAAHTLYEKSHPYLLPGPGGVLDVSKARFEQYDERSVKVSNSKFIPSEKYTIKLEGAKLLGYRSTFIAGMRDPVAIQQIDNIIDGVKKVVNEYFNDILGKFKLIFHVYGKNGVMGEYEPEKSIVPHELCIVVEAVAYDQKTANAICSKARITLLHYDFEGRKATGGNVGFIFTPLEIPIGEVYKFNIYHLMEVEDASECFPISIMEV